MGTASECESDRTWERVRLRLCVSVGVGVS